TSNGNNCSPSHQCTASLKCKYGNLTCSSNADCRPGVCAQSASTCTTSGDCPYATSGGTCAFGATPAAGCARSSDCPPRDKVCSDNPAHTCVTVNDCGGTCHRAGSACRSNADCTSRNNDYC